MPTTTCTPMRSAAQLPVHRLPAVDRQDDHPPVLPQLVHRLRHLHRQLPRRRQHQGLGPALGRRRSAPPWGCRRRPSSPSPSGPGRSRPGRPAAAGSSPAAPASAPRSPARRANAARPRSGRTRESPRPGAPRRPLPSRRLDRFASTAPPSARAPRRAASPAPEALALPFGSSRSTAFSRRLCASLERGLRGSFPRRPPSGSRRAASRGALARSAGAAGEASPAPVRKIPALVVSVTQSIEGDRP